MFKLTVLIFIFVSNSAIAGKGWFHAQYSDNHLNRKYQNVLSKISADDLAEKFNRRNLRCEIKVIHELSRIGKENVKYALLYAAEQNLIDDIELEIFMKYATPLERMRRTESTARIRIESGSQRIQNTYREFESGSECLKHTWRNWKTAVQTNSDSRNAPTQTEILSEMNYQAKRQGLITEETYYVLELLNLRESDVSRLSITEYHRNKARLEEQGYSINSKTLAFHTENQTNDVSSVRYRLYSEFTLVQQIKMIELIQTFNRRSSEGSSNILFFDDSGTMTEQIDLSPLEQLRLSMKLYAREKFDLQHSPHFNGKNFNYRDLIGIAYETSLITDLDAEALLSLERQTKERTFLQRAFDFSRGLDFLVTALTGPLGGVAYALGISIADNFINRPDPEATNDHDIFYGNCRGSL